MARTEEEKKKRKEREETLSREYKEIYEKTLEEDRTCRLCKTIKKTKNFLPNYQHRYICKECHKNKTRKWRNQKPELNSKISRNSHVSGYERVFSIKNNKECEDCRRLYPHYVMDFHHEHGRKIEAISRMSQRSDENLKKEINKCIILCANCHRNRTQKEAEEKGKLLSKRSAIFNEYTIKIINKEKKTCGLCSENKSIDLFYKLKSGKIHTYCKKCILEYNHEKRKGIRNKSEEFLINIKEKNPCKDCNKFYRYWVMDLDHVSGKNYKSNELKKLGIEEVEKELLNCEIVCANCHRIRTWKRKYPNKERMDKIEIDLKSIEFKKTNLSNEAKELLIKNHYAKLGRPPKIVYEAILNGKAIAVAKYCSPLRMQMADTENVGYEEILELDRFCIDPNYQAKNLASMFLGASMRMIKKELKEIKVIVSFADPSKGHTGTIYLATNWVMKNNTGPSYEYEDKLGNTIHKKTIWNRAKKEKMDEKSYAQKMNLKRIDTPGKIKYAYYL